MLLERDAALAGSIRTAALRAGLGQNVTAVMGVLTLCCSVVSAGLICSQARRHKLLRLAESDISCILFSTVRPGSR